MVRIAFPTGEKGGLDDQIYERFGRAPTFTIVDVDPSTGRVVSVEVVRNPGHEAGSGAGVKAAQVLGDNRVQIVAGPSPGPNAFAALQYFGIKVVTLTGLRVRDALKRVLEEIGRG